MIFDLGYGRGAADRAERLDDGRHPRVGRAGDDDLFKVTNVVKGTDVAGTLEETGCKLVWPA